jgi:hypothetical protein
MPSFKFVDGADNAHIHSNSSPERRRYDDSSSIRASGTSARTRTSSDTVISGVRSAFRIARLTLDVSRNDWYEEK